MALALQSRISEVLAVDIHPAARIGRGILLDHGTGVVVGETAVIGNYCSMLQGVTLGGTGTGDPLPAFVGVSRGASCCFPHNRTRPGTAGKETGDRHPKIGDGVLIGAQATILGNILIGDGAQVAAGSLVLKPVEPHTMVAGNPAKVRRAASVDCLTSHFPTRPLPPSAAPFGPPPRLAHAEDGRHGGGRAGHEDAAVVPAGGGGVPDGSSIQKGGGGGGGIARAGGVRACKAGPAQGAAGCCCRSSAAGPSPIQGRGQDGKADPGGEEAELPCHRGGSRARVPDLKSIGGFSETRS